MRTDNASSALIVDDQPLRMDGLEALLCGLGVEEVARATSYEEASSMVDDNHPEILIANYALALDGNEGEDGVAERPLALLGQARAANTGVKCIVFSDRDDPFERACAFRSGATAFCVKHAAAVDFAVALRQAFEPSMYLAPTAPPPEVRTDDWRRRPSLASYEARDRNPALRCRRSLEPTSREVTLGYRADGEVPSLEYLPKARSYESDRGKLVGTSERSPRRRRRLLHGLVGVLPELLP